MDGVPVKISERYKPPRKIALPPGYQQRLAAETVVDDYDFKLERSILEKMGEWKRVRQAAQDSLNERIKSSELANQSVQVMTQSSSSTNHTPDTVSPNPTTVIIPSSKSVVTPSIPTPMSISNFHSHNDSILLPMQISQPKFEVQTSKASHFNISDFEADTSSPFDNMELKTINEMEELAHVLQPLNNSPDANKNISCYSANTFNAPDLENTIVMKADPMSGRCDILPSYHSFSSPVQNNYSQSNHLTYNLLANHTFNWSECHATKRRCEPQQVPTSAMGSLSLQAAPAGPDGSGGREGWKSVPDIVQELEREVQDSAERRTVVRPSSYGSPAIKDWPSWPSTDSSLAPPSPAAIESPIARQVAAMGFDAARAQRAVDALGADQKKVVDYLLQVASLESFYPSRNVERALLANGLDRARAVMHLDATNQLLDLGFREEDIFDALVRFQNDRDKALDHLIS